MDVNPGQQLWIYSWELGNIGESCEYVGQMFMLILDYVSREIGQIFRKILEIRIQGNIHGNIKGGL